MPTLSKLTRDRLPHPKPPAFEYLEATLWPDGAVCPHCGTVGNATKLQTNGGSGRRQAAGPYRPLEVQGKGMPEAIHGQSRDRFRAWPYPASQDATGRLPALLLQEGHFLAPAPPHAWRSTYKTAWFLSHRIREAMRDGQLAPMGGSGKVVEVDETYIGRVEGRPEASLRRLRNKNMVLTLVERGGSAR